MKAIIGLVSFALAIAPARAIDLTCRGEMNYYEPRHIEVTIPPGATIVDLDKCLSEEFLNQTNHL